MIEITLTFEGGLADKHQLDFYDAAHALVGFERSLALVTHFVLNGEIITQAPALKGARIFTEAPADGSWKVIARISALALAAGSVGRDSPVGYAVTSMFDAVLHGSMGFHVDYDKTFQQQLSEQRHKGVVTKAKVQSLIEKCETSIADIHRPMVGSRTAEIACISGKPTPSEPETKLGPDMTPLTYEYLMDEQNSDTMEELTGKVSSYNINTFKGRAFIVEEARTVSFELTDKAKTPKQTNRITQSLRFNNADKRDKRALIEVHGYRVESRNGRLKHLNLIKVNDYDDLDL